MDSLSGLLIVIGSLLVAVRGAPMIFAPRLARRYVERKVELFTSTRNRCRLAGVLTAAIATAMLFFAPRFFDESALTWILYFFSFVLGAAAFFLVLLPDVYRSFVNSAMRLLFLHDKTIRAFGVVNVVIGATLIYVGEYVI